jgi:hypothetical protein
MLRLKTGADWRDIETKPWARRVFRPTVILVPPGPLRLPWQVPAGKPAARRIHRRWENFRPVLPTRDAATVMTRESTPAIRRSLELSSRTSRRA